ncbi:hypothetical protein MRX96_014384 [Rhipicephalus microplus]
MRVSARRTRGDGRTLYMGGKRKSGKRPENSGARLACAARLSSRTLARIIKRDAASKESSIDQRPAGASRRRPGRRGLNADDDGATKAPAGGALCVCTRDIGGCGAGGVISACSRQPRRGSSIYWRRLLAFSIDPAAELIAVRYPFASEEVCQEHVPGHASHPRRRFFVKARRHL